MWRVKQPSPAKSIGEVTNCSTSNSANTYFSFWVQT